MNDEVAEATRGLAETTEGAEEALRELLERDRDGPWSFDEVSVGSGLFGEFVDSGIVERESGAYRLVDREAVRAGLAGDGVRTTSTDVSGHVLGRIRSVDRHQLGLLVAVLSVTVALRVGFSYADVFRATDVVLAGNDPYMYHHAVELLVDSDRPAFDLASLGTLSIELLQFEIRTHDTLLIVVLWWGAALLGNGPNSVATVVAWYPVVAGCVSVLCVYAITQTVTGDRRVSTSTGLLLAVVPAHAFRTALGFGDHHAFDYLLLAVTLLAVTHVSRLSFGVSDGSSETGTTTGLSLSSLGWICLVGLGVAAQTVAWRGGPLLLVPLALYAVVRSLTCVNADVSPLRALGPLLGGLLLGAAVVVVLHFGLAWASTARVLVVPLLAVGVAGVAATASVTHRLGLGARLTALVESGVAAVLSVTLFIAVPPVRDAFVRVVDYFVRFGSSGIAETQSLFAGTLGVVVGPLLLFGLLFYLGVPYLVWGAVRGVTESGGDWLLLATYGGWLLLLATAQNRFSGELSVALAPFVGVGFVHLASSVGLTDPPRPFGAVERPWPPRLSTVEAETVARWFVVFLLVSGLSVVQTGVKVEQTTIDDGEYRAGVWLRDYSESHGLDYPENYVLSSWGDNRRDNYLVNGETESYFYARDTYSEFLVAQDTDGWYERLRERVGFVLIRGGASLHKDSVYHQLHTDYGSRTTDTDAASHFAVVYTRGETDDKLSVVRLVPGATVTGTVSSEQTVVANATVTLPPDGTSFEYSRRISTNANGSYAFTTPYPGVYTVAGTRVRVTEDDVVGGTTVNVTTDVER